MQPRQRSRLVWAMLLLWNFPLLLASHRVCLVFARIYDDCDPASYAVFPASLPFDYATTLRNYTAASDGSWAQLAIQIDASGLWEIHAFVRCGFDTANHADFNTSGTVQQVHAVPPRGLALTDTLQAGYVGYGVFQPYTIRAFQTPEYLTGSLFQSLVQANYIQGWQCNASTPAAWCQAPYAVGCSPSIHEFVDPGTYECTGDYGNLTHLERLLRNSTLSIDVLVVSQVDADWRKVLQNGTLDASALNVSVLFLGEDYEPTPLGRAEYVKLFGLLFGIPDQIKDQFRDIALNYEEAKSVAHSAASRPSVLYGYAYGSTFYFGSKYQATFLRDANAYYVFGENDEQLPSELAYCFTNGIQLGQPDSGVNFTLVGANSSHFWTGFSITTPTEKTVRQVLQNYTYAANWTAVLCDNLYDATKQTNPNPIFEQGVLRPDLVLRDQIRIFHPELEPGYTFNYYRKMQSSGPLFCPFASPVPSSQPGTHLEVLFVFQGIPRVFVDIQQTKLRALLANLVQVEPTHVYLWYPTNVTAWLDARMVGSASSPTSSPLVGTNNSVFMIAQVYSPAYRELAVSLSQANVAAAIQQVLRDQGSMYTNTTVLTAAMPSQTYVGGSGPASGLGTGALIGIIVGTFVGGVVLAAIGTFAFVETRYHKRKRAIWQSPH
ncbi:hypothetical protein CCYA_CCYA05G1507 [Cyanidiococcus yangmingshanensis]|nr:hypothetical protein CCYA_CCYA05G1507 [Cyanidiococcus yangmingshanensis]